MTSTSEDAIYAVHFMDAVQRFNRSIAGDASLVRVENGRPDMLLHGGSHFHDAPHNRTNAEGECPMDAMRAQVKSLNLVRPTPRA